MVTFRDYGKKEVEISLSVLVELMTVLGAFREHIVLVGGWIPYFLLGEKKDEHTGSLDIDIALDFRKISTESYSTILELLKERGYIPQEQPFIFHRVVEIEEGDPVTVWGKYVDQGRAWEDQVKVPGYRYRSGLGREFPGDRRCRGKGKGTAGCL